MMSLTNFPMIVPPYMMGKWRLTSVNYFPDSEKTECTRFYIDIVDI
jgi:hypothetical protein